MGPAGCDSAVAVRLHVADARFLKVGDAQSVSVMGFPRMLHSSPVRILMLEDELLTPRRLSSNSLIMTLGGSTAGTNSQSFII